MGGISVQGAIGETGRKATTELTGFIFNSMAVINGHPFGVNSSGLFWLNHGNTDNGTTITRMVAFPSTDFQVENPKRFRFIDIGFEAVDTFTIIITADDNTSYTGTVTPNKTTTGLQRIRVPISRSVQGRYFMVKIITENWLRIDSIRAVMIPRSSMLNTY